MRTVMAIVTFLCVLLAILVLIGIGWILPFFMVWEGGWWGIGGLGLYMVMLTLSRFSSTIIK